MPVLLPDLQAMTKPVWRIQPTLDVRERFESRVNRDFQGSIPDHRTDLLSRWRPGLIVGTPNGLTLTLQYQYSNDAMEAPSGNKAAWNSDLAQLNVRFAATGGNWTVGRQRLDFGSHRLVSSGDWGNASKYYDGARFQDKQWDVSLFRVGAPSPRPTFARLVNTTYKWRNGESSALYKHDATASGDTDFVTLSHWFHRKDGRWTIDVEPAVQWGHTGGRRMEAWAWHSQAAYLAQPRLTVFAEVNAASGGSDSSVVRTFDNLFPSNHGNYGIVDMVGWRNMNDLAVGAKYAVSPQASLGFQAHTFSLRDPSDAFYGDSGAANKGPNGTYIDPTGSSGRDLGREFDLDVTWSVNKASTVTAGFGVFQPGGFVRNLNGGVADPQVWGFVSVQLRF